jgi:hypothetical protein
MPLTERRVPRVAALAAAAAGLAATAGLAVAGLGVVALAVLGPAPAAQASIGVGIQANPVTLSAAVRAGGSYTLPSLYVVNTGSQAESITVEVKRLSSGTGQTVPASWIKVGSTGGQLQARQQELIPLQLNAPAGAKPGRYRSDLVVTGSAGPAASAGGVQFGAAAATGLEFSIVPGPVSDDFLGLPPWKWWLIGIVALGGLVWFGVRRSGLRVRFETKSFGEPNA